MKLLAPALLLLLLAAPPALAKEHPSLPLPSPVPCATPACPAEPEKLKTFLIQFFMWYNAEDSACLSRGGDAYRACQTKKEKTLRRFLTPFFYANFYPTAENLDVEPIVWGNDMWDDITALPVIQSVTTEGPKVLMIVHLPQYDSKDLLTVTLTPVNGTWRIESSRHMLSIK